MRNRRCSTCLGTPSTLPISPTRTRRIGLILAYWLALFKLALELLEGTALDLDQLRVIGPPGLANVVHKSTTLPRAVIN
jgi:hypothetical protein